MDYESKPQPDAYRRICQMLDVRPAECLLIEDNIRNLEPAKALGMTTVLVHDGPPADASVTMSSPPSKRSGAVEHRHESQEPCTSS